MFTVEKFYEVIYQNIIEPLNIRKVYFKKFGSVLPENLIGNNGSTVCEYYSNIRSVLFYDQEPIFSNHILQLFDHNKIPVTDNYTGDWRASVRGKYHHNDSRHFLGDFMILANSEHSTEKEGFLKYHDNYYDWYYFYHGFAALDWFGNIPYRRPITQYSKVFISFNNLYTEKRSYRLSLVAKLLESGLKDRGFISMNQSDIASKIKNEIFSSNSSISRENKKLIFNTMLPDPPKLTIDTDNHDGSLSANDDLEVLSRGLWHIVTETIFYDQKLHLTEKIFKPIVAQRPFILVGAPGNLAYLKTYGFKSFEQWIDESYDQEQDHDRRLDMIVGEIKKLCSLPEHELARIYQEMRPILQHNFNWFYGGGFRKLITAE
jgi:hypothetical protein